MNEQVSDQTVRLAVRTGKVTLRLLLRALAAWYRNHQRKKDVNRMAKDTPHGKQSVKQLLRKGDAVNSLDIGDTGILDFKRVANRYGVDFAIVRDRLEDTPKYLVFFKSKDVDAITRVLKEYSALRIRKKELNEKVKQSIRQKLKLFKEKIASMPHRDTEKRKEREL